MIIKTTHEIITSQQQPIQFKPKPWGEEIWFAQTEKYAGKLLKIYKGHRLSLQYHEQKIESQYLLSGKVKLTYGPDIKNLIELILNPGDKFDLYPYTIHRLEGLEDSVIIEVSTPELDDVIKLSDDYGRHGKGNNEEIDKILHKTTLSK